MPRRRYEDEEETDERTRWSDDDDQGDHGAGEEAGLKPVIIGGVRIPTLMEIRQHINANAWNGQAFTSHMTHRDVFAGECEYASTALSEMLTGTGKNLKSVSWKYRVRGLYSGDLSAIKSSHGCDARAFTETGIAILGWNSAARSST